MKAGKARKQPTSRTMVRVCPQCGQVLLTQDEQTRAGRQRPRPSLPSVRARLAQLRKQGIL